MSARIRVLHVDDDPSYGDVVVDLMEGADERISVVTATSADDGLDALRSGPIDAVVSDYDMPGRNGVEFLEAVREEFPDLPFVLFTGKGSEEVASDAMSAGATDYYQKRGSVEQFELLANRILDAIEQHRSGRERDRVYQALETATQGIGIIDADGRYSYLNEAYAGVYGLDSEDLVGSHWERLYPEEEVERFNGDILPRLEQAGQWTGRSRGVRADGSVVHEQLSLTALEDGGHVCVIQDISERVERERALRVRNQALQEAPIGITIADPAEDGTPIVYANDAFLELTGRAREDVLGASTVSLLGVEPGSDALAEIEAAIREGRESTVELDCARPDADPFVDRVHVTPLAEESGAVTRVVMFHEDAG